MAPKPPAADSSNAGKTPNAAGGKEAEIDDHKAATKIQSSFRGRKARKKVAEKKGKQRRAKADIQIVMKLFEAAHDGTDNDHWRKKLGTLIKEEESAMQAGTSFEAAEARFRLLSVVEERIYERVVCVDKAVGKALANLFNFQKDVRAMLRSAGAMQSQPVVKVTPAPKQIEMAKLDSSIDKRQLGAVLKDAISEPSTIRSPRSMGAELAKAAALGANSGGISAFATARRLAAQPGGREILESTNALWAENERGRDDGQVQAMENTCGKETKPAVLACLPRHLRLTWQPNSYAKIHKHRSKSRREVDQSRPQQELKLRQLRDIIHLLYQSKTEADREAVSNGEPRETMESHMQAYLYEKYNTRTVVSEWQTFIRKALDKYAKKDIEVCVFAKILDNELPESFPQVQEQLGHTILSILKNNLEDASPGKSQNELQLIWNSWDRQGIPLTACKELVLYMYSSRDCNQILEDLKDLADKPQPAGPMEAELNKDCIRIKGFLQVLKNFQLQLTEMYLADFIRLFREVDVNNNAIVTGHQLQDLVRRCAHVPQVLPETHAANLLEEARISVTTATRHIRSCTFSEAVDLCTSLISARIRAKQQT